MGMPPCVHGFPVRRLLCPIRLSPGALRFREAFPPHDFPLRFPSTEELPVFSMADSNGTRQVACSPSPFRSLRLPSLWPLGTSG
jgi:hypothetical protein